MSTIWTPRGEHEVPREEQTGPADARTEDEAATSTSDDEADDLSPEEMRQMAEEIAAAQARIREAPADELVANHVVGLYELAAVHLSAESPDFDAARLAIDAMAALLDGVGDRIAERATLDGALHQLRMAFVERRNATGT